MKRKPLIFLYIILAFATVIAITEINKPYKQTSFVVDGENYIFLGENSTKADKFIFTIYGKYNILIDTGDIDKYDSILSYLRKKRIINLKR